MLWKTEGTGSVASSEWQHEVRDVIGEKLSEPPEEAFELCAHQALEINTSVVSLIRYLGAFIPWPET